MPMLCRQSTRDYCALSLMLLGICGACGAPAARASEQAAGHAHAASQPLPFSAPGRVEARSETSVVAIDFQGIVATVVEEGQRVAAGEVVATIACAERLAGLHVAQSERAAAEAELLRAVRGERKEERARARAASERARREVEHARRNHQRGQRLFADGALPRSDLEDREHRLELAETSIRDAEARADQLRSGSPADLRVLRAKLEVSAARVEQATALLDRCSVRTPMSGTIIVRHVQPGELAGPLSGPIVSVADLDTLRVRAEVDQRDLAGVHLGASVEVVNQGMPNLRTRGTVSRIARTAGLKSIRTTDPVDPHDRDVIEVLVDLEQPPSHWVLGLRVTTVFATSAKQPST